MTYPKILDKQNIGGGGDTFNFNFTGFFPDSPGPSPNATCLLFEIPFTDKLLKNYFNVRMQIDHELLLIKLM